VLQPAEYWEKKLHSVGFGHVDWTEGQLREASLQRLIIAHGSGPRLPRYDRSPEPSVPSTPAYSTLTDITERRKTIDALVEKYSKKIRAPSLASTTSANHLPLKRCVLVTGATGSLGSHIVAYLAQLPMVDTVICLNRLSTVDANERQRKSLEMRGIVLDPAFESKLKVVTTDTSKPNLGLLPEKYHELVLSVTDVVHSAWPISLTRPIRAYAAQFSVPQPCRVRAGCCRASTCYLQVWFPVHLIFGCRSQLSTVDRQRARTRAAHNCRVCPYRWLR
jgi:hypothetical protein